MKHVTPTGRGIFEHFLAYVCASPEVCLLSEKNNIVEKDCLRVVHSRHVSVVGTLSREWLLFLESSGNCCGVSMFDIEN